MSDPIIGSDGEEQPSNHANEFKKILKAHGRHRSYSDMREAAYSIQDDVDIATREMLMICEGKDENDYYCRLDCMEQMLEMATYLGKKAVPYSVARECIAKGVHTLLVEAMEEVYDLFHENKETKRAKEDGIDDKIKKIDRRYRSNELDCFDGLIKRISGDWREYDDVE